VHTLTLGVLSAIAACGLWALSFVSPIVLSTVSPALVAYGRYAAYGLFSLALLPLFWRKIAALRAYDWRRAAVLSALGNLLYYVLLAGAIQLIDVPAPTVIIGLLPLTIPLLANWRRRELPWHDLIVPLLIITLGLALVHIDEYRRLGLLGQDVDVYVMGVALSIGALCCWTWYGVANALWLRSRPSIDTSAWTIAQGITLLPLVALGVGLVPDSNSFVSTPVDLIDSNVLGRFLIVSAIVGIGSSWLATLCWSHASRALPTTLAGQLIVFETVAAVSYGHVYQAAKPAGMVLLGVALLCIGVIIGMRKVQRLGSMPVT
jgi:drug/metabolite transporter (DMT)-like permease